MVFTGTEPASLDPPVAAWPITLRSVSVVLFLLQIDLLLQYLKEDPRKAVKRLAIQDLKLLAKKAPHMWSRKNIQVRTFTRSLKWGAERMDLTCLFVCLFIFDKLCMLVHQIAALRVLRAWVVR